MDRAARDKPIFASKIMLHHFNPTFDTCLETDSSSYGVGAVLMQRENENHDWLPVQYSSRSLNSAEKNYSQVERETLSVIFGVDRFRNYLLGSKFVIKNDHKPLFTLFAKHKPVPISCSARILRWKLKLNQFDYRFVYSPGKDNAQSDFLSRLPLNHSIPVCEPCEIICSVNKLNDTLISCDVVKQYTDQNPDFQLSCGFIKNGCHRKNYW